VRSSSYNVQADNSRYCSVTLERFRAQVADTISCTLLLHSEISATQCDVPVNLLIAWCGTVRHSTRFCVCTTAALQVNQLAPTGCSSSIHLWALRHQEDRSLKEQPLLAGLVVEQQQYPTPEALCAQVRLECSGWVGHVK
jgi:hypothetical protein